MNFWNDPARCPTCGKPATDLVGGRKYSSDCARTMRAFLAAIQPKPETKPLDVEV